MGKQNLPGYYPFSEYQGAIKHWKNIARPVNYEFGNRVFCHKQDKDILTRDAKEIMDPSSNICKNCSKCFI